VFKYVSQTERIFVKPRVFLCIIVIVDMRRATAGCVPQKWRVARTSDLVSRWHSSSDSLSEFRVTGVSHSFELPVSCAAVMIWQRVRFDSDPIIRWLWRRWMTYESDRNIVHITKTLIFFFFWVFVTYNNCLLYKILLVIYLSTLI
jgi:hypothetical protein